MRVDRRSAERVDRPPREPERRASPVRDRDLTFSPQWRTTFGRVDPARTEAEVAFLSRVLPVAEFGSVLDVPCGAGRHAAGLGSLGYLVIGVDADEAVVAEARAMGVDARLGDMRRLELAEAPFDAVICMWASFGYFDAVTNERVLAAFAGLLRAEGRLVLDVYLRAFFLANQGEVLNRGVAQRTRVRDGRLETVLQYPEGGSDRFDWQLFTPAELVALASCQGLVEILSCSEFDERRPPAGDVPRMQLVFERTGARSEAATLA